jgi:hypothetical protein
MSGEDIEEQRTRSSVSFMTHGSLLLFAAWLNSVFDTLRIGLTRVTESKGIPTSRTFLSKPCKAA